MSETDFEKDITDLKTHIETLFGIGGPTEPNGFDAEFNFIDKRTAHDSFFGNYQSALLFCNRTKNRYSNVLPLEDTRVKLDPIEGMEGSDYINANFVDGEVPGTSHAYIATQGPLPNTLHDFWRMVWEQNCTVVVMLTKEIENNKVKCNRYWPETGYLTLDNFKVTLLTMDKSSDLFRRSFVLEETQSKAKRTITHLQYVGWPDHGLPVSIVGFLELVREVDQLNTSGGPIVVHCSAGIGRSGTFCAVHSTLAKLRRHLATNPGKQPSFNLVKTVLKLRERRTGMVQTKEQFMFCYLAILEEAITITNKFRQDRDKSNNLSSSASSSSTPSPSTTPSAPFTTPPPSLAGSNHSDGESGDASYVIACLPPDTGDYCSPLPIRDGIRIGAPTPSAQQELQLRSPTKL